MSEVSESVLRERRFHKERGLTAGRLHSTRSQFIHDTRVKKTRAQRISGFDLARAGYNLGKARTQVRSSGRSVKGAPLGGVKQTRTAKNRFAAMAKAIAGKRTYKPKPARITRRG